MTVAVLFAAAFIAFVVLDAIWLAAFGGRLFKATLRGLLREPPGLIPVGLLYLILSAAVVHFVALPALEAGSVQRAAIDGAVLGLAAYAAYDLTNLATLRAYTLTLAIVDMAWGTAVTAASSAIAVGAARAFL